MDESVSIRRRVLVEGVSKRQILRETGLHWRTLEKILTHSTPPGYRRQGPSRKPKIGPYLDWIRQVLEADQQQPRKQRHTAKRIWERLGAERGFTGGYTIVKDAVRTLKARGREVFLRLNFFVPVPEVRELHFRCNQHLDTLAISDGGVARFTGANVVVLKHLVMNGIDLGGVTLTPEPATLALLVFGGMALLLRRRK